MLPGWRMPTVGWSTVLLRLVEQDCSAFPADAEPFEAVEPGECPLNDPPVDAQTAAVGCAAPRDGRDDAAGSDVIAVDVVVVATVGED
jgi:hypothetical protein